MRFVRQESTRRGLSAGMMLAGAVGLLALPSAVLAFSSRFEPLLPAAPAAGIENAATPRMAVQLAKSIPVPSLGRGQLFPFTPAGDGNRPDRKVTVAVRVDSQTARVVSVQPVRIADAATAIAAPLQIAPTAFNLGVARGYKSFAHALAPAADGRKSEMPEIAAAPGAAGGPVDTRFTTRVTMDDKLPAGRTPRTFAESEDSVDVAGAYRVTRNLDVTAGVRYSQDRNRLRPLTDGKQDSQAVYLGTQFRF